MSKVAANVVPGFPIKGEIWWTAMSGELLRELAL